MELPKIFDALTIPDPDTFRSAANNLHAGNDVYSIYHRQLLAGHDSLKTAWQGDASDQYSATYQQMHQLQQQHQEQLQQAANIHLGVAVLLEAAQIAQDIAIGLLAGAGIEFIAGFFTAGATDVLAAPETAAAIQTEAEAQGSAAAARAALQAGFRALVWLTEGWKNHKLIFDAGGAILGAGSGLIYSVEHHDSLGQTGVNVGMDAWMGFDLGKNLSSDNPMTLIKTLGGTVIGIGQYVASGDKGNEDPFATIVNWSLLTGGGDHGKNIVPEGDGSLTTGDGLTQNIDENVDNTPTTDGGNSGNQPPNNGGGGNGGEPPDDENWTPPNDKFIHQNTNKLYKLLQNAPLARDELKKFADYYVERFGGTAVIPGLKGMERIQQKIAEQYKGDASRILDIARGTIKFDTFEQVKQTQTQIESTLKKFAPNTQIVHTLDRFANPTESGYRDIKLNIRMSNGHIAELQIHLNSIEAVKGLEHPLYEARQKLQNIADSAGRGFTPDEQKEYNSLLERSRAIFEKALKDAGMPGS